MNPLRRFLSGALYAARHAARGGESTRLLAAHPEQRERYLALRGRFADVHETLRASHDKRLVAPFWTRTNAALARLLLPYPPFDFLGLTDIRYTMVVTRGGRALRGELAEVEAWAGRRGIALAGVLAEDAFGDPLLLEPRYPTSHNAVWLLRHLTRFEARTGANLRALGTVVEWGGGYGKLAQLLLRVAPGAVYVLVDTPLLAALQWLYLAVTLGPDRVRVLEAGDEPAPGANVTTVGALARRVPSADLFVSTWALSESAPVAQDFVVARDRFGARHLLLGYQRSSALLPHADRLGQLAEAAGARIEPVTEVPGSTYAFR